MDVTAILNSLNDKQREAITASSPHVLILAGAGSGKTRVLVHRIAWVIKTQNLSPFSILAVTFTNKAAAEMRHRIESLLEIPSGGMWVGTFHSLAHRLLRAHSEEAGLPKAFQVIDADDQQRLIKRIIRELDLDDTKFPPRQSQWYINSKKDAGLRPKNIDTRDPYEKIQLRIYQAYEDRCRAAGLVDFAELLLRAHELWLQRPDVLAHYQRRFRHVLVDEFQDTNTIQYAWLRLLVGDKNGLFVVGDDDQSIYGWRGAKIENIQRFQRDFPDTQVVRLEQNYRSTGHILSAANTLIRNNEGRLGKELWTAEGEGDPVRYFSAYNEQDEARFVVETIKQWSEQGNPYNESAILYRSNAQSRVLEEYLLLNGIPYRVYGGLRFFERAEIKDALSYLRMIANRHDDTAFERVINTPPRGIGERTVQAIRENSQVKQVSLWVSAQEIIAAKAVNARALNAIQGFLDKIEEWGGAVQNRDLAESLGFLIEQSGLIDSYRQEKGERGQVRIENLRELVNAAREFVDQTFSIDTDTETTQDPVLDFLSYTALESGDGQAAATDDCVQLMTLHTAKGLEFPLVFMVGLEEGLFPHELSMEEPGRLEEERRLCYVGMTRARKHLYLSSAEHRRLYGREEYASPSRFLRELPKQNVVDVRARTQTSSSALSMKDSVISLGSESSEFYIGQHVVHPTFGSGVLLSYEGNGPHTRVQVNFEQHGAKWLVLAYANLETA